MTTAAATITFIDDRGLAIEWASMAQGDDGEWVEVSQYENIAVQFSSSDVSARWEGTNVIGYAPRTLTGDVVTPRFRYIRPFNASSGSKTAALFASMQG